MVVVNQTDVDLRHPPTIRPAASEFFQKRKRQRKQAPSTLFELCLEADIVIASEAFLTSQVNKHMSRDLLSFTFLFVRMLACCATYLPFYQHYKVLLNKWKEDTILYRRSHLHSILWRRVVFDECHELIVKNGGHMKHLVEVRVLLRFAFHKEALLMSSLLLVLQH